jgi:hypothetical protein
MILRRTGNLSLTRRSCLGKKTIPKEKSMPVNYANQLEGFSSPCNQKGCFT